MLWHSETNQVLSAMTRAVSSGVQMSCSTARAAAMHSGLPLNVPTWRTVPVAIASMHSSVPPNAPSGTPPPIDFPTAIKSGSTP